MVAIELENTYLFNHMNTHNERRRVSVSPTDREREVVARDMPNAAGHREPHAMHTLPCSYPPTLPCSSRLP
jgi:hypothetical protein